MFDMFLFCFLIFIEVKNRHFYVFISKSMFLQLWPVCLSVCWAHNELCKNGWTEREPVLELIRVNSMNCKGVMIERIHWSLPGMTRWQYGLLPNYFSYLFYFHAFHPKGFPAKECRPDCSAWIRHCGTIMYM